MADEIKISELPAGTALSGSEQFPCVQSGETVKEPATAILNYVNANAQLEGTDQVTGLDTALAAKQPIDADLTAIAALTGTGLYSRTGNGTAAVRSIASANNLMTVTNADGASENPTLTINQGNFALNATQIGNGDVNNTELSCLNTITSNVQTQLNSKLNLAGGTMTGDLLLNGDPTTGLQSATMHYVDIQVGRPTYAACDYGLTVNFGNTYNNGVSGVGATMTALGTGFFTADGVQPTVGQRIWVGNQTDPTQNGLYVLTVSGSVDLSVLTRATDFDQSAEIEAGRLVSILSGNTLAGSEWRVNTTEPVIGTDPIIFSEYTNPSNFLQRENNLDDVASVPTARTNLGLGSMATQNANAVAITGGDATDLNALTSVNPIASLQESVSEGIDSFSAANPAGVQRYSWGASGEEAGANTGYNPALYTYNDDGSFLGNPVLVYRETSNVTFEGDIEAANLEGTNTGDQYQSTPAGNLIGNPTPAPGAATNVPLGQGLAMVGGALIADGSDGLNFVAVSGTSQAMIENTIYISNNAALCTFTLPATFAVGSIFGVVGWGSGGWKIAQNSNQTIHIGNQATTTGTSGYVSSTNQYDSLLLVSAALNAGLTSPWGPQGNVTVYQGV